MSTFGPVSTNVVDSGVIGASLSKVWEKVAALDFSWWSLVASSELVHGASPRELDATIRLTFKDGHSWVIAIRELSSIHRSVTFEVIAAEPAGLVSSALHTIALRRVTSGDEQTFIEWTTDYSSDATHEIVVDSSFKRKEAFADLAASLAV